jgi:hypothetical protein
MEKNLEMKKNPEMTAQTELALSLSKREMTSPPRTL